MTRSRTVRRSPTPDSPESGRDASDQAWALADGREGEHGAPLPLFYEPRYWAEAPDFDTFRKSGWIERHLTAEARGGRDHVSVEGLDTLDWVDLAAVHTRAYLAAVRTGEPASLASSNGFDWTSGLYQAAASSSQGAAHAARRALSTGRPAGSLSAGLHHARANRGAGFCTFNGLALAAHAVTEAGAGAVLILDLDAHFGGGTFSIVSGWANVWHADVSVNDFDGYDPAGHPRAIVEQVIDGRAYLATIRRVLERLSATSFDLVVYNAGMDPFEECGIGGLAGITRDVLEERERTVFAWACARGVPVAFVLAGGYTGPRVSRADLVELHLLTIAAAAADVGAPKGWIGSVATCATLPDETQKNWK